MCCFNILVGVFDGQQQQWQYLLGCGGGFRNTREEGRVEDTRGGVMVVVVGCWDPAVLKVDDNLTGNQNFNSHFF